MNKTLINVIAAFIPNKKKRKEFRKKLKGQKNTTEAKLDKLSEKVDYLTNFLKRTTDIRTLPHAYGNLRTIQLGSAKLLDLIHKICVTQNLQYWMHYGTLIGAIRHKGFIPWDDDIDICMMRDDYEKLIHFLGNGKYSNPDGILTFNVGDALKIFYKNLPIRVDIFPMDRYYEPVQTEKQRTELIEKQAKGRSKVRFNWNELLSGFPDEIPSNTLSYQEIRTIHNKVVMCDKKPDTKNGAIYRGIETIPTDHVVYNGQDIFPIKTMEFEGYSLMAPNHSDILVMTRYGDFYDFPVDMYSKHTLLSQLNLDTLNKINDFLKEDNNDILKEILKKRNK